MASGLEGPLVVLLGMAAFPISLLLTRFFMSFNSARGIYGVDVHKPDKPRIPEMCGASIPITLLVLSAIYTAIYPRDLLMMIAFSAVVASSSLVGAVDDRFRMRGIYKPALIVLCALPIVFLGYLFPDQVYNPTLRVPLFGGFNLPIIYPLTIPIAVSVTSNTVNMLDPLNGSMAGGITIISAGLLAGLLMKGAESVSVFLFALLLFASLGFFYYNRYPSKAFAGNIGQLSVGAAFGTMVILGRVEIAAIVAMFPHVQNSFFFLSRIKRFVEHREVTAKPTYISEDGKLVASADAQSPLTLVRTLLVGKPSQEGEVVSTMFALFVFSSALGLVTLLLM